MPATTHTITLEDLTTTDLQILLGLTNCGACRRVAEGVGVHRNTVDASTRRLHAALKKELLKRGISFQKAKNAGAKEKVGRNVYHTGTGVAKRALTGIK